MSLAALLLLAAAASSRAATSYEVPTTTLTPIIEYQADEVLYDRPTGMLDLQGHVKVQEEGWTLKSDKVEMDLTNRWARASGFVLLESTTSAVWGDGGTFDFAKNTAELYHASGGYRPWYIQAGLLDATKDGPDVYHDVSFTTCNRIPDPDYHFSASKLTVYPRHYVSAFNAFLFWGKVPVFYVPYFYDSLNPNKTVSTAFQVGYSARNGEEFKTATLIKFHPGFYSRLYLDEYTHQGLGTGVEFNLNASTTSRGSLYGYRVQDADGKERWTVLGNEYSRLGGPYSFQTRIQAASDPNFNNDYFRSNIFSVTPELHNSAALVRQTQWSTLRLSAERIDDQAGTIYSTTSVSVPRLDFNTAPLALGGGFVGQFTSDADHRYVNTDGFFHDELAGAYRVSRTYVLAPGWSVVPNATVSETYESKITTQPVSGSTTTAQDALFTRYGGGANFRWTNRDGVLDLSYSAVARSKSQELAPDDQATDRGLETSHLGLAYLWRPDRKAYVRVQGGYDLRTFNGYDPSGARRYDPFRTEVNVNPRPFWNLSALDYYAIVGGNQSVLLQSDWGQPLGNRVGVGYFNSVSNPGQNLLSHTVSYGTAHWRVTGTVRYALDTGPWSFKGYDKLITLQKDFHDVQTFWLYRDRTGANEFSFKIQLRFSYQEQSQAANVEAEREWYPWRQDPHGR